ncbi:MAG: hypothetical protein LBU39_10575 [Desulfobulbaceae bacterium]|jgi:hypothetical protein|nr:hypothetical protein [Desulfobulbaceae bacterium]
MQYAKNLDEILNAFEPEPLAESDLEKYYYDGTMESRTGDKHGLPLEDLFRACCDRPTSSGNAHLLLGHKGCGKSTELNRMRKQFEDAGYPVRIVRCVIELDIGDLTYWDIMVMITAELCQIANDKNCHLGDLPKQMANFFTEEEIREERSMRGDLEASAGAGLNFLLSLVVGMKARMKASHTYRADIRKRVEKRASQWIDYINELNTTLVECLGDKRPILIFEDLDKITEPNNVWEVFNYGPLAAMPFPVIYTFPINLFYDSRFQDFAGRFEHVVLPLIKIRLQNGDANSDGYEAIKKILGKRADTETLFAPDALETLITKTGGSLRELFSRITQCANRARRRCKAEKVAARIELEDVEVALDALQSDLSRRIERKHYAMLAKLHSDPKEASAIEDKVMLLELMRSQAVLEYNKKRWCAVHPLIVDFLKDVGVIDADAMLASDV